MVETPETPGPAAPSPPTGGAEEASRRALRLTRIALLVSLALNLLVAGMVAGALLRGPLWHRPPKSEGVAGAARDLGLGPFYHALAPEDRRALGQSLSRHRSELAAARAALRAQLAALIEALRSEPFDAERLRALFAAQEEALAQRRAVALEELIARLEAMTPAERAGYAERLERLLRKALREPRERRG